MTALDDGTGKCFDRRCFLRRSAAAGLGIAVPMLVARQVSAYKVPAFGTGELQIFSDGQLSLPRSFLFPDSIDNAELQLLLKSHNMDGDTLTPDCNVTLWRTEQRLILFDMGAGPNFMPSAGRLLDNLSAANIDPTDVTDVVFTHGHPDHFWGLLDDFDDLVCPNATYHMSEQEWDYWRAADTLQNTPDVRKSGVVGAQNRIPLIEDAMQFFVPGQEVLPGVEAIDTHGHTPGHISFALHAGNTSVVLLGDAITNVAVSFARPSWPSGADQDPQQGAVTRTKLLDRLSVDHSSVIGYHLPYPGLGRVERVDSKYRFVAG